MFYTTSCRFSQSPKTIVNDLIPTDVFTTKSLFLHVISHVDMTTQVYALNASRIYSTKQLFRSKLWINTELCKSPEWRGKFLTFTLYTYFRYFYTSFRIRLLFAFQKLFTMSNKESYFPFYESKPVKLQELVR